MKAVKVEEPGTEVLWAEIPRPEPGEYDALVRLDACGICNSTDHKLARSTFVPGSFPIVLGHESVGTVVETGKRVRNYRPGDRVFRQVLPDDVNSGGARSVWGGFAEFGLVTDQWAKQDIPYGPEHLPAPQQKLISDVEPALAATMITLTETLDCAANNCGVGPGKSIAVVGTGPVGQAFALFARLLAADSVHVFGRSDRALERFLNVSRCDSFSIGEDTSVEAQTVTRRVGFDIVIEGVGSSDALRRAVDLAGGDGSVFVYGVCGTDDPYDQSMLDRPNVKQVGATEGRVQKLLVDYVQSGQIDLRDWVSHVLPLASCQEGFDLVRQKQAVKVVLTA